MASIYEKLQEAEFGGVRFAGSKTLLAFEQRCHYSRIESNLGEATTVRTQRTEEPPLLHLSVEPLQGVSRVELLFPDVTGEYFQEAESSDLACSGMPYINRADRVTILVDGGRVSSLQERQGVRASIDSFLRRSIETTVLGSAIEVDLVFAKWDRVLASGTEAIAFAEMIESEIETRYSQHLKRIWMWRIAARPGPGSNLEFAHGVGPLLNAWCTPVSYAVSDGSKMRRSFVRSFDRYGQQPQ
jgi:hypothetical protein